MKVVLQPSRTWISNPSSQASAQAWEAGFAIQRLDGAFAADSFSPTTFNHTHSKVRSGFHFIPPDCQNLPPVSSALSLARRACAVRDEFEPAAAEQVKRPDYPNRFSNRTVGLHGWARIILRCGRSLHRTAGAFVFRFPELFCFAAGDIVPSVGDRLKVTTTLRWPR